MSSRSELQSSPSRLERMLFGDVKHWLGKASKDIKKDDIVGRIELKSPQDIELFTRHYALRLVRTAIYDSNWFLSRPEIEAENKIPFVGWVNRFPVLIHKQGRRILAELEADTDSFIEQNYNSVDKKMYARVIGLAVNDLIARGFSWDYSWNNTQIKYDGGILNFWSEQWRDRISEYTVKTE